MHHLLDWHLFEASNKTFDNLLSVDWNLWELLNFDLLGWGDEHEDGE